MKKYTIDGWLDNHKSDSRDFESANDQDATFVLNSYTSTFNGVEATLWDMSKPMPELVKSYYKE